MTAGFDTAQARTLASEALVAAMRGDSTAVRAAVTAVNGLGGQAMEYAVRAWCDTLVSRYQRLTGTSSGDPIHLQFMNPDTGARTGNADDVPPEMAWAGRMILARQAQDIDQWMALISALPEDAAEVGAHVMAVLGSVALTLRHITAVSS